MVNSHFLTPELELSSVPQSNLAKIVLTLIGERILKRETIAFVCFFFFIN